MESLHTVGRCHWIQALPIQRCPAHQRPPDISPKELQVYPRFSLQRLCRTVRIWCESTKEILRNLEPAHLNAR